MSWESHREAPPDRDKIWRMAVYFDIEVRRVRVHEACGCGNSKHHRFGASGWHAVCRRTFHNQPLVAWVMGPFKSRKVAQHEALNAVLGAGKATP